MADVDQSVSAIDQKSSENNGDSTSDEKQSDWVGFSKSIVMNFLHILVFIILGSNFIFFTYYDSLDLIFPFSRKVYFPGSKQSGGGRKQQRGGGTSYSCPKSDGKKFKMPSLEMLKSLGYDGKMSGWPYTMYNNQEEELSWNGFKNWFALTEGESFMMYRQFMQNMFKGGDKNLFQKVPQPLLYVLAYLIFAFGFFIVFMGFILALGGGLGFALVADAISGAVRGARSIQRSLGALPLSVIPYEMNLQDRVKIKRIKKRVVLLFFAVIISALLFIHFVVSPLDVMWFRILRKIDILMA